MKQLLTLIAVGAALLLPVRIPGQEISGSGFAGYGFTDEGLGTRKSLVAGGQARMLTQHWGFGLTYGHWIWGIVCFPEDPCAEGGVITGDLARRFGGPNWPVRPYLGVGFGGMQWSVRNDRIWATTVFGGIHIPWRMILVTTELRHQGQPIYGTYDSFTVLAIGVGIRYSLPRSRDG